MDTSLALSAEVLLAFLAASVAFLLVAKALSRDPNTEPWLAALALATVSSVLLVALENWGTMLTRTPTLIHAGFAVLAVVWFALRRTSGVLGPPAADGLPPLALWGILGVPAVGVVCAALVVSGIAMLAAAWVGLIQAGAVGATWLVHWWQTPATHGVARAPAPSLAKHNPAPPARETSAARVGPTNIFICYRREDSTDVTGRIYDRLAARFGREHVFKDVDSIPLGVDFRLHLQRVVSRCDVFVIVIGDRWLAARRRLDEEHDFVRIEIETALQRQIPVVPVLVGGAPIPAERDLPPPLAPLAYRQGIAVRPDPDFHHDMDRLIQGLEGGNANA